MADMVLTAVLKKLVDIAGNLIVEEGSRLSRLKTDILWIENEMSHIRSYLKDVDTKQWGSSGAINFLGDIWDLAYDMENIIDTYFPKLASSSGRNDWKRHLGWFKSVKCIRNFAVEIEGIKRRVENINRVRQTYGIKERGGGRDAEDGCDPRQSFPHIDEENIIGFDEHIQNLVAKVTDDQDLHCRVVSITGMAGLGKTTLAKKVYKSVQQSFQCSAWIYVSQQPNIKELLRDIGRQVGLEENKCKHNVEANLFEFLSQKRYVIVIDDIWDIVPWNGLKNGIPTNSEKGSRIIITSRKKNVDVNKGGGGQKFLHELQPLDQENSRTLFFNIVMAASHNSGESSCPSQLKKIGEQILERCCGVPLAIVVTAGLLLSRERTQLAWKEVLESMGQDEDQYSSIFALSYKDLPSKFKPCFLYLGLFPEDHEISTFELINLWAAEGFIQGSELREVEDVGYDYLNHLIGRNLIQVVRRRFNGRARSCRIHDILHNLCIRVASEINFFSTHNHVTSHNSALGIRRMTIHGINFADYISLNHQAPKLRAMLYFGEGMYNLRRNRYKDFLSRFKFLHVLSVRYYYLPTSFPNEISNLNHLSYLKLAAAVAEIPYTICNLKSLMTLDLSGCDVVIIPNLIWKMQQLRHILLPDYCNYICKAPSFREVSVPNLQTLQGMSTSLFEAQYLPQYLRKLNNLRELVVAHSTESIIEVLSGATPVSHGLEKLSLLDPWSLELSLKVTSRTFNLSRYENLSKLSLKVRVECLQHDKFPPNLTMLTLKYTYLKEDPMDTLKKLPKLKILKLCCKSYNGGEMVCSGEPGNFPELEVLRIEDMRNLWQFIVEEGGMPKLKDFSFIDCNPKTRIPNRIKSILMIYRLKDIRIS
ncbi:probable disease resistance protein At1g58602 [Camellia sinensis]|uniref:probable disease resistance protein At1g58602 n=1 Tax=Camellia sinensis TaxID=4442 RepID=UPI0010362E26|nr:probable disease resistance protein At1g58602 [Camellia sinensis]XP_028124058.1 probable disease resistance protein At1g58602 [Camellia sinensis]